MANHAGGHGHRDAAAAEFKQTFRQLAPYKHRYEVFRDFVTMAACSLHNGLQIEQSREEEYLQLIRQYKTPDQEVFAKLLGCLVNALDDDPRDILGPLYMELEIANKDAGQFFTPPEVSDLMARLTFADQLNKLEEQPFITAAEPACGAGGMILSLIKLMIAVGHNPAEKIWVQAIDVDRMAALMCYIQLSLWNVPAEVIVGNTLTLEVREVWYTPAHYTGLWKYRLRREESGTGVAPDSTGQPSAAVVTASVCEQPDPASVTTPTQLGFDF
jgi:hypothetical protein